MQPAQRNGKNIEIDQVDFSERSPFIFYISTCKGPWGPGSLGCTPSPERGDHLPGEQPGAEGAVRSSLGPKRHPKRIPQRLPEAKKRLPLEKGAIYYKSRVSAEIDEKRTQSDPGVPSATMINA